MNNKKIRGWVIRILERAYPVGLEADTLFKQLHELGYEITRKEFEANVAYLIDAKFIETQKFGELQFEEVLHNQFYKLTPVGVDLAEGTVQSKGVRL